MAHQICPECKEKGFTWTYDEERSPSTMWGCSCGYWAYEDESFERECADCGEKSESKLQDAEREYWWCSTCNPTRSI